MGDFHGNFGCDGCLAYLRDGIDWQKFPFLSKNCKKMKNRREDRSFRLLPLRRPTRPARGWRPGGQGTCPRAAWAKCLGALTASLQTAIFVRLELNVRAKQYCFGVKRIAFKTKQKAFGAKRIAFKTNQIDFGAKRLDKMPFPAGNAPSSHENTRNCLISGQSPPARRLMWGARVPRAGGTPQGVRASRPNHRWTNQLVEGFSARRRKRQSGRLRSPSQSYG
jgi:hypothetical protein